MSHYEIVRSACAVVATVGLLGCGGHMAAFDSQSAQTQANITPPGPGPGPAPGPAPGTDSVPTEGTGGASGDFADGSCSGRAYALHVPAGYNPSQAAPIVVAMYGLGDDYRNFNAVAASVGWHTLADQSKFIFMAPASMNPNRQSFLYFNADGSPDMTGIQAEMNSILECVYRGVGSRYNIETTKIYWIGFSEGASFVGVAASYLSQRLRAVGIYGGSAPRLNSVVQRLIPLFYVAGTADFSYSAIVAQSETWTTHPLNRQWVTEGHSFIGLNGLVTPTVVYNWMSTQTTGPVVSGF